MNRTLPTGTPRYARTEAAGSGVEARGYKHLSSPGKKPILTEGASL